MHFLDIARDQLDEMIDNRRHLHAHPEIGFDLPETVAFVTRKLEEYGFAPDEIQHPLPSCVTATIGQGNQTLLLRADMDALPIREETTLSFASTNGNMHACGHDLHTAALLGVARILKREEAKLPGKIKFLFQPAEELLIGGKAVIEAGVLENPPVDAAIAMHVSSMGKPGFTSKAGPRYAAGNNFRITITGQGGHGAYPHALIDPVMVGANIMVGVQSLLTREVPFDRSAVLTMGKFESLGGSVNVIPNQAILEGTFRTLDSATQDYLKERFPQMVRELAQVYRAEATIEFLSDVPVVNNDPAMYADLVDCLKVYESEGLVYYETDPVPGSEDFAFISQEVPSFYFYLNMPDPHAETLYPLHHSRVTLDENMLPYAVSSLCDLAFKWFNTNTP